MPKRTHEKSLVKDEDQDFYASTSSLANLYVPDRPQRQRKRPKHLFECADENELSRLDDSPVKKPPKRSAPGPSAEIPEPQDDVIIAEKRSRRKEPTGRRKKQPKNRRPAESESEWEPSSGEGAKLPASKPTKSPSKKKSPKKSPSQRRRGEESDESYRDDSEVECPEPKSPKKSKRKSKKADADVELSDATYDGESDLEGCAPELKKPKKKPTKSAPKKKPTKRQSKKKQSRKPADESEDTSDKTYDGESDLDESRVVDPEAPPTAPKPAPRERSLWRLHSPVVFHAFITHCLRIEEVKEHRSKRAPRPGEDTDPKFTMRVGASQLWKLLLVSRRLAFKIQEIQLNTDLVDNSEVLCSGDRFILRNLMGGGCRLNRRAMDVLLAEYRLPLFSECITRSFDEAVYAREMPCRVFNATILTMRKGARYDVDFRNPYAYSLMLTFSTGTIEYGLDLLDSLHHTFPQCWRVRFVYLHGDSSAPVAKCATNPGTRELASSLKSDKTTLNELVDYFQNQVFQKFPEVTFTVHVACPRSSRLRVDERLGRGKTRVGSNAYDDGQNTIQTALLGTYLASQNHVQFRYDNVLHSNPKNCGRYFLS